MLTKVPGSAGKGARFGQRFHLNEWRPVDQDQVNMDAFIKGGIVALTSSPECPRMLTRYEGE